MMYGCTYVRMFLKSYSIQSIIRINAIHHFKARKDVAMKTNRLYTKDEVLQAIETALNALDNRCAPSQGNAFIREHEHLDNDIPQKTSPVDTKLTLTIPEAARLIGVSKPKMYDLARAGMVHNVRVGKKILISRQSLLNWLTKGDSNGKEAC